MTTISAYPAAPPPAGLSAVSEAERIHSLDVLRGFALLGIFMVNMQFFALPFMQVMFDESLATAALSDRLSFAFVKAFCEYKFISLFSLLFGAGFAMQLARAEARTGAATRVIGPYIRRLVVLLAFGLAHAIGLWYGDILFMYACTGAVLLALGFLPPRVLFIIAGCVFGVGLLLSLCSGAVQAVMVTTFAEEAVDHYAEARAIVEAGAAPRGFEAIKEAGFDPAHPFWIHGETTAFKIGPYWHAVTFRVFLYAYMLMAGVFSFLWHVLAMFLLGAALMKLQFFAPEKSRWHRLLVFVALPIGLLIELVYGGYSFVFGHQLGISTVVLLPVHEIGSVALCLGYVGVWCTIVDRGWLRPITRAIANVGRMALTNYILQTVIATFLMYHWGLQWFGEVRRVEMIGLVLAIYLGQVIFSAAWLQFFRIGPLEWLWRTLTYLKLQPIVRSSTSPEVDTPRAAP